MLDDQLEKNRATTHPLMGYSCVNVLKCAASTFKRASEHPSLGCRPLLWCFFTCVCLDVYVWVACVPWHRVGQRTSSWSWFSPPTMWIPGDELRFRLGGKCLYPSGYPDCPLCRESDSVTKWPVLYFSFVVCSSLFWLLICKREFIELV